MDDTDYNWKDIPFPHFRPVEDELHLGRYYVELSLTCYPYGHGSSFDLDAFPDSLRHLGSNGNTNFYFVARDEEGEPMEDFQLDVAIELADYFNERYHDMISDIAETWEWESFPLQLSADDLVYWK